VADLRSSNQDVTHGARTRPKSATPERLWSTAQLAEYLGVPVKTIHQWRYMQKGPRGFRVGRHIRFRPADVRVWEDEQLEASA
jgi:excisionase family DNA binding protein